MPEFVSRVKQKKRPGRTDALKRRDNRDVLEKLGDLDYATLTVQIIGRLGFTGPDREPGRAFGAVVRLAADKKLHLLHD